jgi:hypothetical protein
VKIRSMNNTEIYCLKSLANGGWLNPPTIARMRWKNSQQIAMKIATVRMHLMRLVASGFAIRIGDYYEATDAGRSAAEVACDGNRPIVLGLA